MRAVFEKYCTGTSYPTIEPRYISCFPVPRFDVCLANQISDLIIQSRDAKKKSQLLLAQAKQRVEELIEEGIN